MGMKILHYEQAVDFLDGEQYIYPYEITHVFIEQESKEVVGVANIEEIKINKVIVLNNIDIFFKSEGYEKRVIESLKRNKNYNIIAGVSGRETMGFWKKLGAKFYDYNYSLESYNFLIEY